METNGFLFTLLSGVVIGMLLSTSLRWIGGKLLGGTGHKKGGDTIKDKELIEGMQLHQKKEV